MPGPVAGIFFYLYLIVAIFSRKIVGWEVQDRAAADLAATLIRQAVLSESCITRPVVLHADNGSPMKGATMKTTMEKPGITPSYSRPRFSNNNPFSEARFRTCKYRPNWPSKGFAAKADAQAWVKSCAKWYNGEQLHSAIRFVTSSASFRRTRVMLALIARRLPAAPFSLQKLGHKTQNDGQAKPAKSAAKKNVSRLPSRSGRNSGEVKTVDQMSPRCAAQVELPSFG